MSVLSNVRLFAIALVSALLSLVFYGMIYEIYKPNGGGLLILVIAVGVFFNTNVRRRFHDRR